MLSRALDTHAELKNSKDMEWIHVLLSFLKTFVNSPEPDFLVHEEDIKTYISDLVQTLKEAASTLDAGTLRC